MCRSSRIVLLPLLLSGVCLAAGCSDDSTGPKDNAPPGEHLWSARYGDASFQYGDDIRADVLGNVVVTGCFEGSVDFGDGALTSAGQRDFFLAKFDADNALAWSKRFGDGSDQDNPRIAADPLGDVFLVGRLVGSVDFGGGALTSAGNTDVFVAKFGPGGSHVWSKRFGDASNQGAQDVVADVDGNVIVAGILAGTVNFGGGVLTGAGINDIFVAKFGPGGAHAWSQRFGDANNQFPSAVDVDTSGNVVVVGLMEGTVNFGGGNRTSGGGSDAFVAKFASNGTHVWSQRFGDASSQSATAVACDASGNVVVAGYFSGNVNFGGGTLTSAGSRDVFVAKFDPAGNHLWSQRFGDASLQSATAIAADAAGNVTVTGDFEGTVDFGGGLLTSAGGYDVFIAKLASAGTHLWSQRFGDANVSDAKGISVEAAGNVVAAGMFVGAIDFGGGVLTSAGVGDIFIAKFRP